MKKRKATLCLALAAVFGISSVAGCSKTPNNSGQDEKAAESQAGSAVGGSRRLRRRFGKLRRINRHQRSGARS